MTNTRINRTEYVILNMDDSKYESSVKPIIALNQCFIWQLWFLKYTQTWSDSVNYSNSRQWVKKYTWLCTIFFLKQSVLALVQKG